MKKELASAPSGGRLFRMPLARSVQCYLLLGTRLFQQSMRNALAPLLVFMSAEFEIGTAQKGTLLSAIAAGYFFTQVPGGALADKIGAKNVVTGVMTASSACCIILPTMADQFGIPGLWLTMALMGAVQGPLFPTSTVFLSRWMPKKTAGGCDEKAWGTSMLDIGISVGSLVIIPTANSLAGALGWRLAYRTIGLLSLGFTAIWWLLGAEEPSKCKFISAAELAFLEENVPKPGKTVKQDEKDASPSSSTTGEPVGWLGLPNRLLLHPGMWAVFIAHIAFNFGAYYMTNWNPTYYAEVLKIPPEDAKYHLMMPHFTNLAAKSLNPTLVGLVERFGFSLLSSRRIFTATGFFMAAALMLPINQLAGSPWTVTVLFSLANASFGLAPSGFKANYLDITERYVGVISGYGNTLGTVASWVGPQLVALVLQEVGSWDAVLLLVSAANVFASLIYILYATVTPIERDVRYIRSNHLELGSSSGKSGAAKST